MKPTKVLFNKYTVFSCKENICHVENENVKEKGFKELKNVLLEQKYSKKLIEANILKTQEIPLEILRQRKPTKNEKIIPFITTCNLNNPNIFSRIKQSFNNFQYSKTIANIFQKKKLVNAMNQAPILGRLLFRSKLESQQKNPERN